ncbi:B12-binding domain-containing radical SAM protein [Candidatus Woesearchaeota archaeon]|nr:B12-binding domain-containing radical SAM protein [Candidatus Woesearchaeota archaeon]
MENYDAIFVFPKLWEKEFNPPNQPPYGLLMCSDLLLKKGYNVFVYDERLESFGLKNRSELVQAVKHSKPLFFGISSQSGPMIENGLLLSKFFKQECPDVPVVWGGVHPTLLPEQTIADPLIDAVIRGEGELPSLGLADNLKQGNKDFSNINGLYWKDKEGNIKINKPCPGVPNLDEIDMRWDLVNPQHYIRDIDGKKWLGVITSRGCPFRCGFCYNISFFGMSKFRGWSPKKSIEEIKKVLEWGVNFVNFDDDYIFGDPLRMWKILDLKKEEGLDFNWKAPIRGHLLRDSLTKRIKEGGCSSVTIGAESGSFEVLEYMTKDSGPDAYYMAAKNLKKYDVQGNFSWILGYPGETLKDVYITLNVIKDLEEINPKTEHVLNIYAPYPGTPSFEQAIERGFKPPQSLEGWTDNFREACKELSYINEESKKFMEAIRWAGIFRTMYKRKRLYVGWVRPLVQVLGTISNVRWNYNMYSFPIEQKAVTVGREVLKRMIRKKNEEKENFC